MACQFCLLSICCSNNINYKRDLKQLILVRSCGKQYSNDFNSNCLLGEILKCSSKEYLKPNQSSAEISSTRGLFLGEEVAGTPFFLFS